MRWKKFVTRNLDTKTKSSVTSPEPKSNAQIELATVAQLHDLGFKLVTLASNGKPSVKWSHAYEHPEDIIPENLAAYNWPIHGIATIFGRTRLTGPDGRPYYLCGFDCDSETIARIFNAPIIRQSAACIELAKICSESVKTIPDPDVTDVVTKLSLSDNTELRLLDVLKRITYVTKSGKPQGFHFYWLEQELYPAIHLRDCKKDSEFEIKTDKSSSALTLPPSTHRDDVEFRYSAIGRIDRIALLPGLYRLLMENILEPYLLDNRKKERAASETSQNNHLAQDRLVPITTTCNNVFGRFQVLNTEKEERIVSLLLSSYKPGFRNEICFALSGTLFVCAVSQPSANKVVASLCDHTKDCEKESRLTVVQNTYKNGIAGRPIAGTGALVEILDHIIGDENAAYEIVSKIIKTINLPEPNVQTLTLTTTIGNTEQTTAAHNTLMKPADEAIIKYQQLIFSSPSIRTKWRRYVKPSSQ